MSKSSPEERKPFQILKQLVWEAYLKVKANDGAAGVDGVSIEDFEKDLKNNLYKIWNRMSSGTYFPPPVLGVEVPKPHGGGRRLLGVPTVADRVAQTVAALALEPKTESLFHDDSFGYRPGRSAEMALAKCRERCWQKDWVLDLDVAKFFDSVDHDRMIKAVEVNITPEQRWVVLYVRRWLTAPIRMPDGEVVDRDQGTPQGSLCSAEHKLTYEQCWVMRSVGLLSLVRAALGSSTVHNEPRIPIRGSAWCRACMIGGRLYGDCVCAGVGLRRGVRRHLGYKDSTLVWYRGCWRRLGVFAARGVEEFSLEVAMAWVDAAFGFFDKERSHHDREGRSTRMRYAQRSTPGATLDQAQQANAAHNPALLIRVRSVSGVG